MKVKLKKYFVHVIFFCFIIATTACNDSINEPIKSKTITFLNGKIDNYTLGSNAILKREFVYRYIDMKIDSLIVLDSTTIKNDGTFSLFLNKPPDIIMRTRSGYGCAGLNFSNDFVKLYPHSTYSIYKDKRYIGFVYCADKDNENRIYSRQYYSYLVYAEDSLKVSGECISQSGNYKVVDKTNIILEKGWNKVVRKTIDYSSTLVIQESKTDNDFYGNWIFQSSN